MPGLAGPVGWALVALAALLSASALGIAATDPPPAIPVAVELEAEVSLLFVVAIVVISMAFSVVGAVILSKRPDNSLGWVFVLGGALIALDAFVTGYGYRALAADPGSLPAGRAAAWLGDVVSLVGFAFLTVFLFLLFPEGRLRARAERRTALAAVVAIGLTMLAAIVEPTLEGYLGQEAMLPLASSAVYATLYVAGYVMVVGAFIASIVLLIRRRRRAVGRERDQLRILVWAAVVAMVMLTPVLVLPETALGGNTAFFFAAPAIGLPLIPISVGVAILRHGLLDIDLVVRRTVVVAVLGGFVIVVYVGVVVGVGVLVGSSGNAVLSAIAAAAVALAFQPVRRWAQRLANRFVYGKRATPYEVLHEFSERVAGSYGTEDVLPRMAAILAEGTGAERAQVWLTTGSELRPTAAWPEGAERSRLVSAPGGTLPDIADVTFAVPVQDGMEMLGALSVTKRASEPVTPTEEKLVADLALQAGLVLRNVRLVEDLRASRGRLVAAQDEERRKIERDIHDGAQQQLVALQVKQRLAEQLVDRDLNKAKELLGQLQGETAQALEDLRALAHGIYPPLLADQGLVAALESQSRRAALPVTVRANGVIRYSPEVEATVYFCVLEALQNATKYSRSRSVEITLEDLDGVLGFDVVDDGAGFDPGSTARGSGLQNMVDRLEALGGTLAIRSSPGAGTSLSGKIPVQATGS
ncbi:MAG: sensor histidine kinase [Actinomycetota bacterium]|nr:sensor histidine kinase [Actinomycetota bacterium]MDH5223885.1 sensor histidine kinase [Actinomycetota bacterium]